MLRSEIAVLDHGYVRLSSFTQPLGRHFLELYRSGDEKWTGDLEIVRRARQSYDAEWRAGLNESSDEKLIHYLLKNGHTSPFEAMVFTFDVKAPIFVLRQWHRHRTWAYSEVSARYAELPEEFYVPAVSEICMQSSDNKQMRTKEQHPEAEALREMVQADCYDSFRTYQMLLNGGCPRELARGVLPMNTYSRMSATVNLHNLFHFLKLRLHEHAQYEIRVYAEAMLELITPIVPVSVAAFKQHVLIAKDLAARDRAEVQNLRAEITKVKVEADWAHEIDRRLQYAKQRFFEETGEQLEFPVAAEAAAC